MDTNDPANSALIIVPLETTGLETDAVLKDKDDLAAVLSGTTNEQTTMGRKTLTDSDLSALAPDDTADSQTADIPDVTWTAAAGNAVSKFLICYDPDTTAGTDSSVIPLSAHDRALTPDGNNFVLQSPSGFFSAS